MPIIYLSPSTQEGNYWTKWSPIWTPPASGTPGTPRT